ncbi:hypothetical protein E7X23_24850 [Bacteroides fragilis]|nr:hypothetical protein E7X23_24850 [Bacteroides fragilis]
MTIKVLRIKELGLKTKNLSSALSTFMLSASSAVNLSSTKRREGASNPFKSRKKEATIPPLMGGE